MDVFMIVSDIINQTAANFDFGYMLTINALTYFVIKVLDDINGDRQVSTWQKRIVLLVCTAIVAVIYKIVGYPNDIILINSTILAPVFWSWIARPILVKFGLGYKQQEIIKFKANMKKEEEIKVEEPNGTNETSDNSRAATPNEEGCGCSEDCTCPSEEECTCGDDGTDGEGRPNQGIGIGGPNNP